MLARVNSVKANVVAGFSEEKGLKLKIDSDVDVQVISFLKKEMEAQLGEIKTNIKSDMIKKINEASGGVLDQFNSIDEIKNGLTSSAGAAGRFEEQLKKKRAEAEKQLRGKTEEATQKAAQNAVKELGNQFKKMF